MQYQMDIIIVDVLLLVLNNGLKISFMLIQDNTKPMVQGANEMRAYTPPIIFNHIKWGVVCSTHRVNVLYSYHLANNSWIYVGAYGFASAYSMGFNCLVFVLGD